MPSLRRVLVAAVVTVSLSASFANAQLTGSNGIAAGTGSVVTAKKNLRIDKKMSEPLTLAGGEFSQDEDWLKSLALTVKNTSTKNVVYAEYELVLQGVRNANGTPMTLPVYYNADVKKGGLKSKYDTIILPDLNNRDTLLNGLSALDTPESYAGGISDEGSIALKKFVSEGGTLVALNGAADAVIDLFALPVTNVVKNAEADKFFCSGALLQVSLKQPSRATAGEPAEPVVMFWRGPVFEPRRGFKGNILASYAPTGNPLLSGVLLHPEAIQGKAAALEVEYGKGRVFLYGFRPQWRAQSHGTYKMLFNTLYAYPAHEPSATEIKETEGGRGEGG